MIKNFFALAASLLACLGSDIRAEIKVSEPSIYTGMCDASAAVALTDRLFAVASDEDSVIRIYSREQRDGPVQSVNLSAFLDLDAKKPESDLEGGARVGDRVYWITSHGRNKVGRERPSRERFFATQIVTNAQGVQLKMVGKPYEHLLNDLPRDPRLKSFHLAAASKLEPKARGALNIEGLSAAPDGRLLIGFRNPIPDGKALLVPMLNPDEVIHGRTAKFGDPILLDLGGLGIRDMAYADGKYLIIGGPYDGKGQSHVFQWAVGTPAPRMIKHARFKGLNPEAIIFYPDKGWDQIQILSDDGKKPANGKPCRENSPNQQHFRSVWLTP
ncbi:MAG: DUF3616 domain-containing protein [Verrucomicrobia bacterium]|nr:MAG: DUF3616 domain-containing protein [Verrucomicrobiota bacterium]